MLRNIQVIRLLWCWIHCATKVIWFGFCKTPAIAELPVLALNFQLLLSQNWKLPKNYLQTFNLHNLLNPVFRQNFNFNNKIAAKNM
ncbi:MAG: hypothetical protein KGZ97_10900 [Bacteroidetes bacterium]|nr:hypothetical protein [Bacteroidota bacterium]